MRRDPCGHFSWYEHKDGRILCCATCDGWGIRPGWVVAREEAETAAFLARTAGADLPEVREIGSSCPRERENRP